MQPCTWHPSFLKKRKSKPRQIFFSCVNVSCSVLSNSIRPHGILQATILEWVDFPFSRESSQPRNRTGVSCIAGGFFTNWATREGGCENEVRAPRYNMWCMNFECVEASNFSWQIHRLDVKIKWCNTYIKCLAERKFSKNTQHLTSRSITELNCFHIKCLVEMKYTVKLSVHFYKMTRQLGSVGIYLVWRSLRSGTERKNEEALES